MINAIRKWFIVKRLMWANRIVSKAGYSVVRIVTRGDTNYIIDINGAYHRLGKVKGKP